MTAYEEKGRCTEMDWINNNINEILNKNDALELADFIEFNIFPYIRNDDAIGNMRWLCLMCDIWRNLTDGIVGRGTDEGGEQE